MSYNSSFTGQQADAALQRAAIIQKDGDGTKFLSNDGTYKEAGDKTNVLILSLENDLANGQKDSPITAEVSASLVDAITNGKACVIKSANSDILVNLQQIGNNVTIIMEQISRVGQTFVAVNTSITVNTSTNVIADYQTGAIVLETEGDGSKFLADDGTYKGIVSSNQYLDMSIFTGESGTLSEEDYQKVVNAYNNKVTTVFGSGNYMSACIAYNEGVYDILVIYPGIETSGESIIFQINYTINESDKTYSLKTNSSLLKTTGDGTQFLSDDGTYKAVGSSDYIIPYADFVQITQSGVASSEFYNGLKDAVNKGKSIKVNQYDSGVDFSVNFQAVSSINQNGEIIIYFETNGSVNVFNIKSDLSITSKTYTMCINGEINSSHVDIGTDPEQGSSVQDSVIEQIKTSIQNNDVISISYTNENFISVRSAIEDSGNMILTLVGRLRTGEFGIMEMTINVTEKKSYKYFRYLYDQKILTESEYSALGTTPETDNVLYFVTPD